MKSYINRHQKYKAIGRVMNNHADAFTDKSKAQAMKEGYDQLNSELTELISSLLRPISTIHRPKQASQSKLEAALVEHIGMGTLLATDLDNAPLLDILKVYKLRINRVSAYKLYEMAVHVAEELENQGELGIEYGLTAEKLASFREMVTEFGQMLEATGDLLKNRKSGWDQLNRLLLSCSKMLKQQIDPFVIYNEKEFPDLYREYMLLRGSRKRRRKLASDPEPAEISGTVTDSVSGLPLAGAVINLLSPESIVTTDEDGYYLLEELAAGEYVVSCYLEGYDVPANVTVTAVAGDSLVVDFTLTPVQQQQAA